MPIKNKDGSVYKLRSPPAKPLKQEWIDTSELILHNFASAGEQTSVPVPPPVEEEPDEFVEEIKRFEAPPKPRPVEEMKMPPRPPKIEVPPPEPVKPVEPEPVPEPKPERKLNNLLNTYCLPAEQVTHFDSLYGQSYTRNKFGKKFTFQIVLLVREDLAIRFWTNQELKKGSVVFPYEYDGGDKFLDYRWWKVSKSEPADGGFIVDAMMSDLAPDFTG